MKKILALVLATLMVMGLLAACGNNNAAIPTTTAPAGTTAPSTDPSTPSEDPTTEPSTEPSGDQFDGELLDAPEEEFQDPDIQYYHVVNSDYPDEEGVLGLDTSTDILVLYTYTNVDGYVLYEYDTNTDEIAKYFGDVDGEVFEKADDASIEEFQEMLETFVALVAPQTDCPEGTQFKKVDSEKRSTGKAYKYEVYIDGEHSLNIWIDEDTGVCVEQSSVDGSATVTVTKISNKDAKVPAYK